MLIDETSLTLPGSSGKLGDGSVEVYFFPSPFCTSLMCFHISEFAKMDLKSLSKELNWRSPPVVADEIRLE